MVDIESRKSEIIDLYKGGWSECDIRNKYGMSQQGLNDALRRWDEIETRNSKNRQYYLDEECFSELNNESEYWIGFIAGDGCVHQEKNKTPRIQIQLKKTDIYHLVKFKEFLSTNYPINHTKHTVRISVSSSDIAEDLSEYNITERKTGIYKPTEKLKWSKSFWRGLIDADGSLNYEENDYGYINLTGSYETVLDFAKYCKEKFQVKWKPYLHQNKTYSIGTKSNVANEIIEHFYRDAKTFLARKNPFVN